ncbi:hypothetical protein B0T25DRAFT_589934 [Lasiosphaeria hispida]|uniref:Nucleoporin NUP82 n=1 Tax=Lasiosphaeria hispida TaxID=260671 RepID=A0AAJ0HMR6_9PEZI|nr:hypothetical protein B0T25DRAFT_589934 [Lasiosphaeria hispida]
MPKIKSYAPGWLNEPALGHKLFEPSRSESLPAALAYAKSTKSGPRRTIAYRGTEVFYAVGKQIRWGDLAQLKAGWESKHSRSGPGPRIKREDSHGSFEVYDEEAAAGNLPKDSLGFRTIKTPVAEDIRELVMSPQQDFLAVLTSHTVHICILPSSTHLLANDDTPFKAKFWTLGPTTHVTSRAAVASAVWHPLGVNGTCLATVTKDAVVRVWELSQGSRGSFDSPTLAIDLKRLADGTFLEQDFSASTSATNKTFSPDSFDMEVAAACFPGRGAGGWSPMTLWIAMVGGDVYALCPLLPKLWSPPATLIPSLSVSIVAKLAAMEDDPQVSQEAKILAQQQLEWMSDLDNQEPTSAPASPETQFLGLSSSSQRQRSPVYPGAEIYVRPSRPGTVPRLQGPFEFDLNPEDEQDDEVELKDIYVIGEKINTADLMMGEDVELDDGEDEEEGLSLSVICLLSTSGQVKICLDVEGVQAQWLPPRGKTLSRVSGSTNSHSLLTFQTFDTVKPAELTADNWPVFSEDVTSRYSFYVTHCAGITHVSLASWVSRLEKELQGESEARAEFRMDLLAQGHGSGGDRIYTQPAGQNALAAAISIKDNDVGHFVLSATHGDPVTLFFDTPEPDTLPTRQETPQGFPEQRETPEPLTVWEPRPLFHPSEALDRRTAVPPWLEHLKTSRRRAVLQQEVRLSVATLELLTEGHRLVSTEVFDLNNAVAELFRKCEALQSELREQIIKANEVKQRVDMISGNDDSGDDEPVTEDMLIKNRLRVAKQRQEELAKRMEALRRKLGRATSRDLSEKERAWTEEVRTLGDKVLDSEISRPLSPNHLKQGWKRFEEAMSLRDALFLQAEQLQKSEGGQAAGQEGAASPARGLKIPTDVRKAKATQVMSLLERETALVEAVKSRLERLSVG